LAHAKLSAAQRAFIGADLNAGRVNFIQPTLADSARLARTNVTYVQWALKRQEERTLIEAGLRPLVPTPRPALASPSAWDRVAELVSEFGDDIILDILAGIETRRFGAVHANNGAAINSAASQ
jgi:hypothetical protein